MLDSLQVESLLLELGFVTTEVGTHAIGFEHQGLPAQVLYVKDGRGELAAKRKAVYRQPLVVHPDVGMLPGFERTRIAELMPNRSYKNANMTAFPRWQGTSATGLAVDVPDPQALRELLAVMGFTPQAAGTTNVVPAMVPEAWRRMASTVSSTAKAKDDARRYETPVAIDFGRHCCQGRGRLPVGKFALDDLTMVREGRRRLWFAPIGNRPLAPVLALVGIMPGNQVERFARALAHGDVAAAAKVAAFDGVQTEIKQLLFAHDFAHRIGVSLRGNLNDNPAILTTSLVKCCLMQEDGYRFSAPDVASSPVATHCATQRLVAELRSYPTLRWVAVFGRPAWEALQVLRFEGAALVDVIRRSGMAVVQFPHFSQNFQQRMLFACDAEDERHLLGAKPEYRKYAAAAGAMREALLAELAAAAR